MSRRRKIITVLQGITGTLSHASPGGVSAVLGHPGTDAALCGGLKQDALHEVFAAAAAEAAATGFALALAARVSTRHKWILWVRQDFSALEVGEPHGSGLLELGIDPARLLLVHVPDATAALRASVEGLTCKGLAAVIIEIWGEHKAFDLTASRKLTLMAERHAVTPILLRFGAEPKPSSAATRWLVRNTISAPDDEDRGRLQFDAALVRNRQGCTERWIMEWDRHEKIFRESTAHSRASVSATSDRPVEAPLEGYRKVG
jgi:protein ImuA